MIRRVKSGLYDWSLNRPRRQKFQPILVTKVTPSEFRIPREQSLKLELKNQSQLRKWQGRGELMKESVAPGVRLIKEKLKEWPHRRRHPAPIKRTSALKIPSSICQWHWITDPCNCKIRSRYFYLLLCRPSDATVFFFSGRNFSYSGSWL